MSSRITGVLGAILLVIAMPGAGQARAAAPCFDGSAACHAKLVQAGCLDIHRRFANPGRCLPRRGCRRPPRHFVWVCARWPD
jgi:hypothetical protein